MSGQLALQVGVSLLCGILLGMAYFALLYRTAQLHAAAAALQTLLPLYLLRAVMAGCVFWGLAQFGAWSLLAGLAGFLLARQGARYLVERH